jgi:hypothetical protein
MNNYVYNTVNQILSEEFMEKYMDKIDFYWVSRCQHYLENL